MGTIRKINCVTVVTRFKALFTNQLITKQPKQEAFIQSITYSPEGGFQTDAFYPVSDWPEFLFSFDLIG